MIALMRARTIVYGFAIAALGTYLVVNETRLPDIFVVGRLIGSTYLVALATYLYNDLTDYNVDKANNLKTYESKKQYATTRNFTVLFFAVSIAMSFSINVTTGIDCVLFSALAIAYSHPRTHLKDRFVIKTVVTGAGGFIASMMGAHALGVTTPLSIISSFVVFLFYFVNGPLNDIRDVRGDREGGRRTIPIVIGVQKTFTLVVLIIFSIGAMIVSSYLFFGVHLAGMAAGLLVCSYVVMRIIRLSRQYENKEMMNKTRTVVRNSILASQLAMWAGLVLSGANLF